jgi:uncharacterized glyoxalase superfamily protein PhnB
MGVKKRPDDMVPWMPGFRYGALLPELSLNLVVRDPGRSAIFYREVLQAEVHYVDVDFAALRVGAAEVMLHADHTHDSHPWFAALDAGDQRGLGAQIRLLGTRDPDEVARLAARFGAEIAKPPEDKGHGWREVLVRDPDGYEWAIGVLIPPARGPHGLQPAPHPA